MLAAHLAYLLLRQQDAVGLVLVGDTTHGFLPPRARSAHLVDFCGLLDTVVPRGGTALESGLLRLVEGGRGRGLVFVFSDFFAPLEAVKQALAQVRARRHAVLLVHVLDPDEVQFPFDRLTRFRSMESEAHLLVEPRAIRGAYLAALAAFRQKIAKMGEELGAGYTLVLTDERPEDALHRILSLAAAVLWRVRGRKDEVSRGV